MNERVLPHDLAAEHSLLGGLLVRPDGWLAVEDAVTGAEFYRPANGVIFEAIVALARHGGTVDLITVRDRLASEGQLDAVGGPSYLAKLVDGVPRASHVDAYAEIVREKARLRALIAHGSQLVSDAYAALAESGALLEAHEEQIRRFGAGLSRGPVQDGRALAAGLFDQLTRASQRGGSVTGVATGFSSLDRMTTGLQPGDLVLLAGRPSMGKTSLAGAIAWHAATTSMMFDEAVQRRGVLFASVEQPTDQITLRITCLEARVNYQRAKTGQLLPDEWERVSHALQALETSRLLVEDTSHTTAEIRQQARRVARQQGLSLVVIDYLQILQETYIKGRRRADSRAEAIGQMSGALKHLAKELRVPVLVLSQLNRDCEKRVDKRPQLSDLRDSGALEQDADLVLLIYRDEVYHDRPDNKGQVELIVAKSRNGPTGTLDLYWHGEHMRFYERDDR